MPYSRTDLETEALEALEHVWFIQRVEATARTEYTLTLRLYIRPDLFVQAFLGERSGALYFALIEGSRRIYGMDRESGAWHVHPYDAPDTHLPLTEAPGPQPLLSFVADVESVLLSHDLL